MAKMVTATCKNCGREFQAKACRLKTKYGVTFCSRDCYLAYYKRHGGHPILYQAKPKITLTCKKCGKTFKVKPSLADRKYCSLECALMDIHRSRKGSHLTDEEKQKIRERFKLHQRALREQLAILKQQGFKVLSVDKVRPDIVARKDGKVYAVEVELDKPDYEKYEGIEVFDDVIWILKKPDS